MGRCRGRNWLYKLWNVWWKRWNGGFVMLLCSKIDSTVSVQRKSPNKLFSFFVIVASACASSADLRTSASQKEYLSKWSTIQVRDAAVTTPVWQSATSVSVVHLFMYPHQKRLKFKAILILLSVQVEKESKKQIWWSKNVNHPSASDITHWYLSKFTTCTVCK